MAFVYLLTSHYLSYLVFNDKPHLISFLKTTCMCKAPGLATIEIAVGIETIFILSLIKNRNVCLKNSIEIVKHN